jgi:hypothetical protein
MRTDQSSIESDFIPDYTGWENDFDERCNRQNKITVKLQSADLLAGAERAIRERAEKNGMRLETDHADNVPSILVFKKDAPRTDQDSSRSGGAI